MKIQNAPRYTHERTAREVRNATSNLAFDARILIDSLFDEYTLNERIPSLAVRKVDSHIFLAYHSKLARHHHSFDTYYYLTGYERPALQRIRTNAFALANM